MFVSTFANANWYEKTFHVMGTEAKVQLWYENKQQAQQLIKAVEVEMQRIDQAMSPYITTSELSKVNQQAFKQPVNISEELFALIKTANKIAKLSNGAFDITYASVGHQYNYREKLKPTSQQIAKSLVGINYQSLLLDEIKRTIRFKQQGTKIDLGGIAKGHAVKNSIALLKKAGVKNALVSAGGDTALLGDRRGRDWLVAIKHPRAEDKTAVHLPLINEAISTSGDYERYFIEDGIRYHHILNPKTGQSANQVISVSVIGEDATYVDALSTTLFVLGLQPALQLINNLPSYEAIIIDNQQKLHFSQGLTR